MRRYISLRKGRSAGGSGERGKRQRKLSGGSLGFEGKKKKDFLPRYEGHCTAGKGRGQSFGREIYTGGNYSSYWRGKGSPPDLTKKVTALDASGLRTRRNIDNKRRPSLRRGTLGLRNVGKKKNP